MFARFACRSRIATSLPPGRIISLINKRKNSYEEEDRTRLTPKPLQIVQFVKPLLGGELSPEDITAKNANVMITQSARNNEDETAFQLYDKLKPYHEIFPRTYRSLLMIAAEKPGKTSELLNDIKTRKVETNAHLLGGFLINMVTQKNTTRATKIARQMISNSGILPSFECTILLDHLIKEDRIDDVKEIYASSNTQYENIAYQRLITTAIDVDKYDLVLFWYLEMKKHGVKLPTVVTESILNSCISSHNFTMVYELGKEFSKSQMLTGAMYETIFVAILRNNALSPEEKISLAQEYFHKFLEDKIEVPKNSTLFERVLDIFITRNTPDLVQDFLEKLDSHHFQVAPSMIYRISDKFGTVKSLSPLIISLLDRVKDKGSPAVQGLVYGKIMNIYSKDNMPRAIQYFKEMLFVNLTPNSVMYSQLMLACCESQRVKDLLDLKKRSDKANLKHTRALYSLIVDTLDRTHHEHIIPDMIREMQDMSYRLDTSLRLQHRIDEAIQDICPGQNLADPPRRTSELTEFFFTTTQNLMLNLYSGEFSSAEEKLNAMKEKNISIPSFIHAAVIRFRGKNDNIEDAMKYFNALEKREGTVFEAAMNVFSFHNKYDEILRLYDELSASSISPTLGVYNFAIEALREQGQVEKLESVLDSMQANEIEFSPQTVYELVKTYCSTNETEKAKAVIESVKERMFAEEALAEMVNYFVKTKQLDEAMNILIPYPDLTTELISPILRSFSSKDTELRAQFAKQLDEKKTSPAIIFDSFSNSVLALEFMNEKNSQ